MRSAPRPIPRLAITAIALVVVVLAFAVRLAWVLRVQSPHGAVYSDMGGYVFRAQQFLGQQPIVDRRTLAFYPWGTHVLIALEFAVFGQKSVVGIAVVHALVGAVPAGCATLIAARLVSSRILVALCGLVVALWQPQITYVGFFMSEVWFSAALMIAAWLFLRHLEHRSGAFGAGCALSVAFVVRPQVLLTCVFVAIGLIALMVRPLRERFRGEAGTASEQGSIAGRIYRKIVRPGVRRWGIFLAPIVLTVLGSSIRLYHLSGGRIGVISENDGVNRIFADTTIGKVASSWKTERGEPYGAWYSPAMKQPVRDADTVTFNGYIGDPVALDRIRVEHLRGVPITKRIQRALRNITYLAYRNFPNPEEDFHGDPRRALLQRSFATATLGLMPIGLIGVWSMRRRRAGIVVIANLATIVIVAALYFAEARHRVPYDPFLIVAATVGLATVLRHAHRLVRAARSRLKATGALSGSQKASNAL